MKTYGTVEVYLHAFLTSALDGGEKSVSRPDLFTSGERARDTNRIGSWVGLRAGLDAEANRKIIFPWWESNSGLPASSLATILTEISCFTLTLYRM
jgi:hypothetical protein